ncbi:MAG: M56 family metallopeptidase [Prevotellaceae bacterium]|jgi:hypothetical protein|nr:M56 family metallopeptidase [Prevotellaceae bacterium]
MNILLAYLLKIAIVQCLLTAFYQLLLSRDTFYRMIRYYFTGGIALSYILPIINFKFNIIQYILIDLQVAQLSIMYNFLPSSTIGEIAPAVWWKQYPLSEYFIAIALAGILVMFLQFARQYLSLQRLRVNQNHKYGSYSIVNINSPIKPFSFGNRIYINPGLHNAYEYNEIIQHELVHIRQQHSIDVIISTINKCLLWWNPVSWMLNKAIRNNLEYIVDDEMLKYGFNRKHYQYHLLYIYKLDSSNSNANHFNLSNLKKRIKMMNKEKTKSIYKTKYLLLIPVLTIVLLFFNLKKMYVYNLTTDTTHVTRRAEIFFSGPNLNLPIDTTCRFIGIKGINSVGLDKQPLILIDRKEISPVELRTDFNPAKIKSINMVKGENTIEKYGDKAKNMPAIFVMIEL